MYSMTKEILGTLIEKSTQSVQILQILTYP